MRKLFVLLSLLSPMAFATGPSLADVRAQPLSMNDQGELLYKYIIFENPTGAHTPYPMISGLGTFKDGNHAIVSQEILNADPTIPNSDNAYWAQRGKTEEWFNEACEQNELPEGFIECNVQSNLKDQWLTLAEFKEQYSIDLLKAPHLSLIKSDIYASNNDRVYVEYDFEKYLVLQFKPESCTEDGLASLMITNTIMNDRANERNSINLVSFDCAVGSMVIMK